MSFPFKLPSRYEPTEERREGGQGYIYVCTDKFLQRKVAIKVMKNISNEEGIRKEISSLSEIRSRHVAEVYDLVSAKRSSMVGLVQEFVPGESLETTTDQLTVTEYLRTLWQVASGLTDIHSHRKIHRDIKPGNIRADAEGVLKILDFGLAVDTADATTVQARGTRYFLAPELYEEGAVRVTQAADVYAFGVLAWFLAHGGRLAVAFREVPPASRTAMPSFRDAPFDLTGDVIKVLDSTLRSNPGSRPEMAEVKGILARNLLYGKHRAFIASGSQKSILSTPGESITLRAGQDAIVIEYDGMAFKIRDVAGDVYVNNLRADCGDYLPGSCVVTLGAPYLRWERKFITIDMSHPGVII